MKKILIHLSDLHFCENREEDQNIVLDEFFKDLSKQITKHHDSKFYIAFSGDIVLAGSNNELYEKFYSQFDKELNRINISRNQRICVPGNHDVSQEFIKNNEVSHEGLVNQDIKENKFNDFLQEDPYTLKTKFDNYVNFEEKFAYYGVMQDILSGTGWELDNNIGVYCLNSAVFSSGGHNNICDKGRLAINTRSISKWTLESNKKIKILIMHHPLDWLNEWSQIELKKLLHNKFNLLLTGHIHDQSMYHYLNKDSTLVECSAPPLLTNKKGPLGYAFVTIFGDKLLDIHYRQWTKNYKFVTGVNFSNTDDGKILISDHIDSDNSINFLSHIFNNRLEESLRSFSSQPIVWVEPLLSNKNEFSFSEDNNDQLLPSDIISNPRSILIKAPPQFGLTCLAHYITKESWNLNKFLWFYLDFKNISSSKRVDRIIKKELNNLGINLNDVNGVILDSWNVIENEAFKILERIVDCFNNLPFLLMQTIDDLQFVIDSDKSNTINDFEILYLLPLNRNRIRKVVSSYNKEIHIDEEDKVISKVVSDLDVLNIHRTPLNCITLLKVAENYFDTSPVNRTKLLEMVLFILFNMDEIPTYKTKPDLKDCEYVLGRFCEKLIRENRNKFTRNEFLDDLNKFCSERLIELEVEVVFDILHINQIIIKRESQFSFRFTYWIFYFSAQRMHHSVDFTNYVFENKRYASFPQIIEFYTGIDRRREDALNIMFNDLKEVCKDVEFKVGLPDDMNPYRLAEWKVDSEDFHKIKDDISENVLNSNLPQSVKDQYADLEYDPSKPYVQSLQEILHEYSMVLLIHTIKAASRALRNSDYVNPDLKIKLLSEISRSWLQVSKVLIVLTPLLAYQGSAVFEGTNFILYGYFGTNIKERITNILNLIPDNIVKHFKNDLFSKKLGPLIYKLINEESNELIKHEFILLLINEKPRNWVKYVEKYISDISYKSFYLFDIFNLLCMQYKFSFATQHQLEELKYLIKMSLSKHEYNIKNPRIHTIKNIPNKILPKRLIDD